MVARAIAYHEAGHAVVAYLENIEIESISIMRASATPPRGHHNGRPAVETAASHPQRQRMRSAIRMYLAGAEAQKIKFSKSFDRHHDESDGERAADLLVQLATPKTLGAYWILLELQARDMLTTNWHGVEAVAKALLEHGSLSGAEVRQIISAANASVEADLDEAPPYTSFYLNGAAWAV